MKKVMLWTLLIISPMLYAQQESGLGIKAGLNYNSNGSYFNDAQALVEDPMKNIGFHLGMYGKIDLGSLYLRPELLYTRTQSEYDSGELTLSKLDAPLLLGIDLLGPLGVFAGPSLQYILNNEFEDFSLREVENNFTVGAQLGIALNFTHFGIDLRYERGLTENEVAFVDLSENRIDTRPDQLILGLSLKL
ncbi:MAG: PorT family protein [Flavobacteriales bacterium]|nr:PorT family protein [Flavobacteriales bacterium]